MSEKMTMRVGESLVAGGPAGTAAEPEVIIGELDGPFGTAFANLLGDQAKGHSKVFLKVLLHQNQKLMIGVLKKVLHYPEH